jgi:transcriptional regulator with PAS, ATPase and Fis domain
MIGESNEFPRALIGNSPRMRQVHRQIEKLGRTRWPVLILGETGTGKEVVAKSIHAVSPSGPFVTIDCSALVGPLMESELFGHAKGAFTGAVAAKLGMIEMANGGTVFLDEIGELPLDMQVKLLRVLQEKEFRPVGGLNTRRSDFRVIAATNRDLAAEVDRGAFRRDLFYRLNVVTIRLAPLRDRREDIPVLIQYFLGRYGKNHSLTQEIVDAMGAYDWPGNVRELENSMQHMIAINSGPLLHIPDLPSAILNYTTAHKAQFRTLSVSVQQGAPSSNATPDQQFSGQHIIPLTEVERRAILEALRYTKGDRATAAMMLGIGRTTLYRKLKEYQLED